MTYSGCATWCSVRRVQTRSKEPASNGRLVASASTNEAFAGAWARACSSSAGTMSTPTTSRTSGATASASVPAPVPTSSTRSSPSGATNDRSCSRTSSTCCSACSATRSAVAPKRARTSSAFVPSAIDDGAPRAQRRADDIAGDLVVDRPGDTGVRFGEDAVPEQHDRRADRQPTVEPHRERVHRDRPDDGADLTAYADLRPRQVTREAVAVAHRNDPDPRRLVGDEAAAVAGALPGLELLDLREEAVPREHRLEPVVAGGAVERRQPVDRAAAADGVEMRFGQAQRRGGVRRVTGQVCVRFGQLAEALQLGARKLGVAVGGREVGHQPDDLGRRPRQLGEPVPAHTGVELEVDAYAVGNLVVRDRELECRVA